MRDELIRLAQNKKFIHIGIIGVGFMGLGIVHQIALTPGMKIVFIANTSKNNLEKAQALYQQPVKTFQNANHALNDNSFQLDVVIDATASIKSAAAYALQTIKRGAHLILMNANLDLFLGPYLNHLAKNHKVVMTSDAGDQHGVLARMIEEIQFWGFEITQAGSIKGFLNRYATSTSLKTIAQKININIHQCVSFTDGTKLNMEMALLGNGTNLVPLSPGMQGPLASHVNQVFKVFTMKPDDPPHLDYLLGADPGGGVYVIARSLSSFQHNYLKYYKVHHSEPYYLFYRPYHLCHIETTRAIAHATLYKKPILTPQYNKKNDVYSYAKCDLKPGDKISGIGSDSTYGLIQTSHSANLNDQLPITLLGTPKEHSIPRVRRSILKDQPITFQDVENLDMELLNWHKAQNALFKEEPYHSQKNSPIKEHV